MELPPRPGRLGLGWPLMSWKVGRQRLALTGAGRPGWHPPLDRSLQPQCSNRTSRAQAGPSGASLLHRLPSHFVPLFWPCSPCSLCPTLAPTGWVSWEGVSGLVLSIS